MRKFTYLALLAAMLCLPQWMMAKTDPNFGLDHYSSALSSMCIGRTYDANVVLYNHQNLPVTWSSSNEEYFTVDQNGIITPLKVNGDVPVYAYLRVHTDGDENYNEANDEIEVWIVNELVILRYTTAEVAVTPTNADDILGNGKLSYNYATHTLTMNNWTVNCPTDYSISKSDIYDLFHYEGGELLTVNLVGTNTITDAKNLFDGTQDLTFTGSGSLTVNGETTINAAMGQLTIDGTSLTQNYATDDLNASQGYTTMAFWVKQLAVINSGNFHVTVSTNVDLSSCGSCYTVGWVETLTAGDILTEHVIWSADAANEADINAAYKDANYNGYFFDDQGGAMLPRELEIGLAVDPREVPELKFYDNLTEATIIHDSFGWDFEPGTTSLPPYGYTISIKDGVYYYQGQPYDYWKAPSELTEPLPITYSLSNDGVIELTQTEGDEFSFNVLGLGDVVVTASTIGNTRFQPASITFTIHVIDGQAPTKECVLKWVSGPNAGQLVPANFEFNLQTGDEVEWESMQLVEKDYPAYAYAPSTSIWGSRDYHVASLAGELKLRALMAGDDVFTVQYSRYHYPEGFVNGNFRTIEIPVHIKPTQPALVSDVNFSSSPLQDPNVLFNTANYDPVSHEAQLVGTLTTAEVMNVLGHDNYNSPGWKANLPHTISFELAAGRGHFEVNCSVQPGYEVRIIKGGDTQATDIITSSTPQPYVYHYNISAQTPVVIFVAVAGSPNPAPKRAPAAKQDAPIASFSALAVAPTYPITANEDPDHAGVYYSTIYNETQKYQLPLGTEAYVATISGGDLNLTKVAEGGQVIPANKAFILKSNSSSVVLTPTDAEAVVVSASNDLQGSDSEKAAPTNCYVLSGHSTDYSTTGVGFYAYNGTLAAHKAYIIFSGAPSPAHRMRFIFNQTEQTTGLENEMINVKGVKRIENGQLIILRNGIKYNAAGQIVK